MLLTAGERNLQRAAGDGHPSLGVEARSFTAHRPDDHHVKHGDARIVEVNPGRLNAALGDGAVVLVAGFQGERGQREITTLGRGGSDTTAVAAGRRAAPPTSAKIYTDVDGVYSADPRIVPDARHLNAGCYEEMLELAACGAKVLHLRAVE